MSIAGVDRLARTLALAGSRRAALATLLAAVGTALGLTGAQRASAQSSCAPNGTPCQDGAACCSGRCARKRGTQEKFCRQARDQGICTVEQNECDGNSIDCGTTRSGGDCRCLLTITGRSFCGQFVDEARGCGCASSAECKRRLGKGARCVQSGSQCVCPSGAPNRCMTRCRHLFSAK